MSNGTILHLWYQTFKCLFGVVTSSMLWTLAKVCNPALEHFVEIQVLSLEWAIIMWTSKEFCEVFSKNEYFTLSAIEVPVRRRGSRRSRKQTKVWCRKVISKFSRLQELWKPSSVTVKNCNSFDESSWTFIWFIQSSNFLGFQYKSRVLFRITKCGVESFRTNVI